MKRFCFILLALTILVAGCSNGEKATGEVPQKDGNKESSASMVKDNEELSGTDGPKEEGFLFVYNGVDIPLDARADEIIEELGEPMDSFEAESCAFQGMEKVYTYSGFELHTYEKDGVDRIFAINFIDDSVTTKEGIHLYSDLDSLLAAYGDEYTKDMNQYIYESGDTLKTFIIEDGEIVSVEYMLKLD